MRSRRDFLKHISAAALAAGAAPSIAWAFPQGEAVEFPGEDGMVLRSFRFVDLESSGRILQLLAYARAALFRAQPHARAQRTRFRRLAAFDWGRSGKAAHIKSGGAFQNRNALGRKHAGVRRQWPQSVSAASAGDSVGQRRGGDRAVFRPRLRDVLQRAGAKPTGKHVMFRGLDEVPGKVPPFIRSIPIEKALDADTLVATHMNGSPLPKHHGFPARALVPGWIGAASCKWLTEIKVLEQEFVGNFMNPGYRMPNHPVQPGEAVKPEDTHAVTALSVKSVIAGPSNGASVKAGKVAVHGAAWAGEADISKVEISIDGGGNWTLAKLGREQSHYAWRLWSYDWKAKSAGDYTILSRATDSQGRTQPASAVWNPSGYLNNAVDQVKIHVS